MECHYKPGWSQIVTRLNLERGCTILFLCLANRSDMFALNLSPRAQLIITAVTASLATATILQVYNDHNRRVRRKQLDEEIRRSLDTFDQSTENKTNLGHDDFHDHEDYHSVSISNKHEILEPRNGGQTLEYDESLIREQLARNYAFFGEEGMHRVRQGTVAVVGCGGVGSWAAVMLVRSCVLPYYYLIV